MGELGPRLKVRGIEESLAAGLFADDTVLLAENEGMMQRIVDEFDRVCKRRSQRVSAGKSKVMVYGRAREQVIDFEKPYGVTEEDTTKCRIRLGEERMEEVTEFKYLGTLCKHGSMEGEVRERVVKGRQVVAALERVMKGRIGSMEVKRGMEQYYLANSVISLRGVDMECSTAIKNMCRGNELYERCMWCVRMGWGK